MLASSGPSYWFGSRILGLEVLGLVAIVIGA